MLSRIVSALIPRCKPICRGLSPSLMSACTCPRRSSVITRGLRFGCCDSKNPRNPFSRYSATARITFFLGTLNVRTTSACLHSPMSQRWLVNARKEARSSAGCVNIGALPWKYQTSEPRFTTPILPPSIVLPSGKNGRRGWVLRGGSGGFICGELVLSGILCPIADSHVDQTEKSLASVGLQAPGFLKKLGYRSGGLSIVIFTLLPNIPGQKVAVGSGHVVVSCAVASTFFHQRFFSMRNITTCLCDTPRADAR